MVFTDGSVYGAAVGCGACAAALVPVAGDEDNYYGSKAVRKNVTSLRCELEGIIFGLKLSVKYFQSSKQQKIQKSCIFYVTVLLQLLLLSTECMLIILVLNFSPDYLTLKVYSQK